MHLAFDLGAGSGRAVVGRVADSGLEWHEVHRFHYRPTRAQGHLRWPSPAIFGGLREGIGVASDAARGSGEELETIGVDSWGVDYGLIDEEGALLEDPVAYRDERTAGEMQRAFALMPREEIFRRTGIQFLGFNTLYQLRAHVREGLPDRARQLLMVPDLCHHHLCGASVNERTNASTTQMLDAKRGVWDEELVSRFGLPHRLLPELVDAGTELGLLRPELREELSAQVTRVVAPATHDTASAVAGTPLQPRWAYLSSGTWSLVGVELREPRLDDEAAQADFTNEAGVCGSVRFLKNVMGLWIFEACLREWQEAAGSARRDDLLAAVETLPDFVGFVFPDDPRFLNPDSMVRELRACLAETGQRPWEDPVRLTKVVLDSLAMRYASVLRTLARLLGRPIPGVHVVGGGSRNDYLNQATADAAGLLVLAGPVEATAVGNLLVQAVARGRLRSLAEGREAVARGRPPRSFAPRAEAAWREAGARYAEIESRYALR